MKDKTCKNETCDYIHDNINELDDNREISNKECCSDVNDCNSSKKCCIDMDKIVLENSELKKNVEELSKQNQTYKDNLYKYSAHISQIQSMLNEVPKNQKREQIKFCSSISDLFANASLLKKSDQYNHISEDMKSIFEFFFNSIENLLKQYGSSVHYPEVGKLCNYDYCSAESTEEFEENNIVLKVITPAFLFGQECIRKAQVVVSKKNVN